MTSLFGTEKVACTVDGCDWTYALPPRPWAPSQRAAHAWAAGVDHVLRSHADSHTPLEYLRTIQRLNHALAESRAKECHGH